MTQTGSAILSVRRVVRAFIPNQTDTVLVVCSWLLFVSLASSVFVARNPVAGFGVEYWAAPLIVSIAACFAGLATAIAWGRRSKSLSRIIGGTSIFSAIVFSIVALLHSESGTFRFGPDMYAVPFGLTGILAASLIGTFVAILLVTLFLRLTPKFFSQVIFRHLTRHQMLISLTVLLLIVGVAQNIYFPKGEWLNYLGSEFVVTSIFWTIMFLLAVFWPGWAICARSSWWVVLLALLPMLGLNICLAVYVTINQAFALIALSVSSLSGGVVFVGTLFAVREKPAAKRSQKRTMVCPSVWSIVPLAICIGGGGTLVMIDQTYKLEFLLRPFAQIDWEAAKLARKIERDSGGWVRMEFNGWQNFYWCKFNLTTPAEVLDCIKEIDYAVIYFNNLNPKIDTSLIRGISKRVFVTGGTITPQQLADLAEECSHLSLTDIGVEATGEKVSLNSTAKFYVFPSQPGQIKNLLDSIESFGELQMISIIGPIVPEDWPAVINASQKTKVQVQGALDEGGLNLNDELLKSMKGIRIPVYFPMAKYNNALEFFLRSDATLCAQAVCFDGMSQQQVWDFLFAKSGEVSRENFANWWISRPNTDSLQEQANRFHWAFGWDEGGAITELLIPVDDGKFEIDDLAELKTLSFDQSWLSAEDIDATREFNGIKIDLANLRKLERLYFSTSGVEEIIGSRDLSVLASLSELKHLQSPCVDSSDRPLRGFDALGGLESLTLFGIPSKSVIREVSTLKKLQVLNVVDLNELQPNSEWLTAVQNGLPGVDVRLVKKIDWKPDMPPSFRKHLDEKKKELRKKLLEELQDAGTEDRGTGH